MNKKTQFEGRFSLGKNGIAYIRNKENGEVLEIPAHEANTALSKDLVLVEVTDSTKNEGRVLDVVERAKKGFIGIISKEQENAYIFEPDDFKIPEIIIPKQGEEKKYNSQQKVFVEIERYTPKLIGKVTRELGDKNNNDTNMHGIALEQGFDFTFPEEVEQEADALENKGITDEDRSSRRDLRDILTFTIDPADAKDFDDALSFEEIDEHTYKIGVHIADVSHYVRPGSALDKEAQKRTTSVYLVDRTIPMLPEVLSNGLCSLNQDEEKCAFSALFRINKESGEVLSEWFGKTLIKSNKRFTYEEAQDIIDEQKGPYAHELMELNRLAKIYEKNRYRKGALNFETHEVKFILDEKGKPISVRVKERIDTNKLIEEFMLLANSRVARFMKDAPFFVYRVHDKPDPERVEKLEAFLKLLDIRVTKKDGIISPFDLQKIIRDAEGTPSYDTLQTAVVRSMQKAIYTTHNIGHFGLAFSDYSHFTSPIRRYPDVLAHRLLQHKLAGTENEFERAWFEKMCIHSSNKEQAAVTAERNSIKYKQVEYMSGKDLNEEFDGIVTGVGKFGVFIAEAESLSEGMIRLGDLGNDFFEYQEKKGRIIGKQTGVSYKLGDTIKIKLKKVDLEKKLIDYLPANKLGRKEKFDNKKKK